jgi:hypothetical protein
MNFNIILLLSESEPTESMLTYGRSRLETEIVNGYRQLPLEQDCLDWIVSLNRILSVPSIVLGSEAINFDKVFKGLSWTKEKKKMNT